MSSREFETVSSAPFQRGHLDAGDGACAVVCEGKEGDPTIQECVFLPNGVSIRISPMKRIFKNKRKWAEDLHFHSDLKFPSTVDDKGLVCILEGMAREGIAVAFSSEMAFRKGKTYEVYFGDVGNTRTTLQRQVSNKEETLEVSMPSRVCQDSGWNWYWVCLLQGKLYAGVGQVPGQHCIAVLDDIARQDEDKARFVGLGNSALEDRERPTALSIRNVRLTVLPEASVEQLKKVTLDTCEIVLDDEDAEIRRLMLQYQEECRKSRARSEKFGMPYKPPPPDAFLPWSEVRRLRANPTRGFATGVDMSDPAEKAKQEARRKRFGLLAAESEEGKEGDDNGKTSDNKTIPVEQAWNKQDLVRVLRTDPPPTLWKVPPANADQVMEESMAADFSSTPAAKPTMVPEKIHMFSIDWAAFKQIRTDDIMKYFSIYGPTYVEWLGDLSCNILFEDKFSAARALENMSSELPSPPPENIPTSQEEEEEEAKQTSSEGSPFAEDKTPPDFGSMGWRLGKRMLRKISNDKYGRRGTTARVLLRLATSLDTLQDRPNTWLKPPAGFSTKKVLGPHSDYRKKKRQGDQQGDTYSAKGVVVKNADGELEEHPLVNQGLKASRDGFTVAELEAERAKKRQKVTEEPDETS